MALISMAVWDTPENKRTEYTRKTFFSLLNTVDFTKHRLIIVDNGSCDETLSFYNQVEDYPEAQSGHIKVIYNGKNLGTAGAVNQAWKTRTPGENVIKMDNDVVFHSKNWVDLMEEAIARDPNLGIIGLKRNDLWESPYHTDQFYRSELRMLPHQAGQHFITVEKVNHVMGTCQMYASALLDKIGYLFQPRLYGFDDALAAVRCHKAGFYNAFLCNVYIDHIDVGGGAYQDWKQKHSGEQWAEYHKFVAGFANGSINIFYNPFK